MAQLDQDGSPGDGYTEARLLTTTGENSFVAPSGFGTYLRTIRSVQCGGNSADATNLTSAIAALSGVGEVRPQPGTWVISSTISVLKKTRLIGSPGVIFAANMTPSGDVNQAITNAVAGVAMLGSTTIQATNTLGASTVSVNGTASGYLPVGTWSGYYRDTETNVRIRNSVSGAGFHGSLYRVVSVSGAGPYTVTLERPVYWQFGANDPVEVMGNVNEDVYIAGITYTGTATRLLEHVGTRRHLVEECRFVADEGWTTDIVASFDTFGHDNEFRKCEFWGDGTGDADQSVLALETQEDSRIVDCRLRGGIYNGIVIFDSVGAVIQDCDVRDCGNYGLAITADGNTVGSLGCKIVRGRYNSNTAGGITVANGSTDTRFTDVEARHNPTNVSVGDPGSTVSGTVVSGRFDNGTTYGVVLNATARGTVANDIDVSTCGTGLSVGSGADIVVNGIRATGSITTSAIVSAGYTVVHGAWIAPTGGINVIDVSANQLDLCSGYVTGGNGANLVRGTGGTVTVSNNVRLAVAGGGIGLYASGATFRVAPGIDLSGCAKPAARDSGTIMASDQWTFASSGAVGASATVYLAAAGTANATEANVKQRVERAVTVRKARIDVGTAPSAGKTTTVTLRKNAVDTVISWTLTGTNTTSEVEAASGADYFVNFAAGDYMSVKVATDAGNATADVRVSIGGI